MVQLLALARDEHRIEMIDVTTGTHRTIITDTGLHPDGIVCDGTTIYWTTMGERTGTNAFGEAIYANDDGGVHATNVDSTNRRDIIPSDGGDGKILRAGLEMPAGETAENRTDIQVV